MGNYCQLAHSFVAITPKWLPSRCPLECTSYWKCHLGLPTWHFGYNFAITVNFSIRCILLISTSLNVFSNRSWEEPMKRKQFICCVHLQWLAVTRRARCWTERLSFTFTVNVCKNKKKKDTGQLPVSGHNKVWKGYNFKTAKLFRHSIPTFNEMQRNCQSDQSCLLSCEV